MSELTKRLREQLTMSKFTNRAYLYARMDDDRRVAADRIEALEECLLECADDLECELDARYPQSVRAYACMESDYQRDMSPVYKARALLEGK